MSKQLPSTGQYSLVSLYKKKHLIHFSFKHSTVSELCVKGTFHAETPEVSARLYMVEISNTLNRRLAEPLLAIKPMLATIEEFYHGET